MYANERGEGVERIGGAWRERLLEPRVVDQILLLVATVVVSALTRLPSLLVLGVPRLLALTAALILGSSALFVLSYVVVQRLSHRRRSRKMDATELRLIRYYHQLLDQSSLNPLRRSS